MKHKRKSYCLNFGQAKLGKRVYFTFITEEPNWSYSEARTGVDEKNSGENCADDGNEDDSTEDNDGVSACGDSTVERGRGDFLLSETLQKIIGILHCILNELLFL